MSTITKQFDLRPAPQSSFIGAPDDAATMTVKNLGPGIAYYSQSTPLVSPTVNTGSIASGATATLTTGMYFVSAAGTVAVVVVTYSLRGGVLAAVGGRNYRVVSGVLRDLDTPNWFQPIDDGSTHRPQNIDSMTTTSGGSGVIRVNYPSILAQRVVTFLAEPDEVYAAQGFSFGCSVGLTFTDINVFRTRNFSDEIHYDGSAFVRSSGSSNSPFLVASFTAGVLRITHASIGANNPYSVSLTDVGTTYRAVINGTVSDTEINISFVPAAGGAVVTTADTNMKVHITRPQFQPIQIDPQTIQTTGVFANSNIWIYGIFEV